MLSKVQSCHISNKTQLHELVQGANKLNAIYEASIQNPGVDDLKVKIKKQRIEPQRVLKSTNVKRKLAQPKTTLIRPSMERKKEIIEHLGV